MNKADKNLVRFAQGQKLAQQEELRDLASRQDSMMQSLGAQITLLLEHVRGARSAAVAQLPATEMPTSGMAASMSAPEMASAQALPVMAAVSCPQLSRPQHFDSESGNIRPFLTQCERHFELQAAFFCL